MNLQHFPACAKLTQGHQRSAIRAPGVTHRSAERPTQCHCAAGEEAASPVISKWLVDETAAASPFASVTGESGISVNSHFDSGNIEVAGMGMLDDKQMINLMIHRDPYCDRDEVEHFQWFFFRVSNCENRPLMLVIGNASQASFPEAWHGYQVCYSYDLENWKRIRARDCVYEADRGAYKATITPMYHAVYFAYFAPFTLERHMHLLARMQTHRVMTPVKLGDTFDGHDMDLLIARDHRHLRTGVDPALPVPGLPKVWLIARQHPGEAQSEWFMMGLLDALVDRQNAVSRALLEKAELYLVPNMNPDGTWRGHLRVNGAGCNLNREWENTHADAPEVQLVKKHMGKTGCDFFLDIHGDEIFPYCFISGHEGSPAWSNEREAELREFQRVYSLSSPDFQAEGEYNRPEAGEADMRISANWVGTQYNCFSGTLEIPFKDEVKDDQEQRWSPQRCRNLGRALMVPLLNYVKQLPAGDS